jgi:hypothetical protein
MWRNAAWLDRLLPHACLDALFQAAMLALVSVVLINWTVLVTPTLIGQIPPN